MLVLVNEIRTGQIKPAELDIDTRREVVRYLWGEGISAAEIAKLLDTCDRTVRRDLVVIREANALQVHPGFAAQFAGEALEAARAASQRVRRVAREASTPAAVRVEAERAAVEVMLDVGRFFLRTGHLPSARVGGAGGAEGTSGEGNNEQANPNGKPGSWDELVPELDRLVEIASSESSPAVPIIVGLRDAVKVAQPLSPSGESVSPAVSTPPCAEENP